MTQRVYRVTVRGRFQQLSDELPSQLRARQAAHGIFTTGFTAEGTFRYGPELVGYQFRYLLTVDEQSPEDADLIARLIAEERATADLHARGCAGRIVDISMVCMNDVKIREGAARS